MIIRAPDSSEPDVASTIGEPQDHLIRQACQRLGVPVDADDCIDDKKIPRVKREVAKIRAEWAARKRAVGGNLGGDDGEGVS